MSHLTHRLVRTKSAVAALVLLAMLVPATAGRALAQTPAPVPPPSAGGAAGGSTLPSAAVAILAGSSSGPIDNTSGLRSLGFEDLKCGDPFPMLGDGEVIACDSVVLFVPGYSLDGSSRNCSAYYEGALREFRSWGYPPSRLKTVGLDHGDACDLAVGDYGAAISFEDENGDTRVLNNHIWAGGQPDNHDWVGGEGCELTGQVEQDWLFTPSHCWGHTKDTPIEHLAYHFGYLVASFSSPVDVVAHSMGGLVTQAAHSFSVMQSGMPPILQEPYRSIEGKYADVVTSGTPFQGINRLNGSYHIPNPFGDDIDVPDPCRLELLSNDDRGLRPGQCYELRAGSIFMRTMQTHMTAESGGGRWSVVGSNAFNTNTDIPIDYSSAVGHPTHSKYIYYKKGIQDPVVPGFSVTHVSYARVPTSLAKGYYDYTEDDCSGLVLHPIPGIWGLFVWPACWDAGLWMNGKGYGVQVPGTPPVVVPLCDNPNNEPPEGMSGKWCHNEISPRHNRLAFMAVNTARW